MLQKCKTRGIRVTYHNFSSRPHFLQLHILSSIIISKHPCKKVEDINTATVTEGQEIKKQLLLFTIPTP